MATSNRRRSGNPAVRSSVPASAPDGPRRTAFHERSRGWLVRLARLPKLVIPGAMLALMLIGLAAPLPIALAALTVVVLFVGWLAVLSWPVLDARGKFVRGLMIGLVVGSGVARMNGWL